MWLDKYFRLNSLRQTSVWFAHSYLQQGQTNLTTYITDQDTANAVNGYCPSLFIKTLYTTLIDSAVLVLHLASMFQSIMDAALGQVSWPLLDFMEGLQNKVLNTMVRSSAIFSKMYHLIPNYAIISLPILHSMQGMHHPHIWIRTIWFILESNVFIFNRQSTW